MEARRRQGGSCSILEQIQAQGPNLEYGVHFPPPQFCSSRSSRSSQDKALGPGNSERAWRILEDQVGKYTSSQPRADLLSVPAECWMVTDGVSQEQKKAEERGHAEEQPTSLSQTLHGKESWRSLPSPPAAAFWPGPSGRSFRMNNSPLGGC